MASGAKEAIVLSIARVRRVRIVPTVRSATSAAVAVRTVAIVHRAVIAPIVPIVIPSCARNTSRAAKDVRIAEAVKAAADVTNSPIRTRRSRSSRR